MGPDGMPFSLKLYTIKKLLVVTLKLPARTDTCTAHTNYCYYWQHQEYITEHVIIIEHTQAQGLRNRAPNAESKFFWSGPVWSGPGPTDPTGSAEHAFIVHYVRHKKENQTEEAKK